ncbi:MAG: hypothetical protein J6J66_07040 [Clostridia bacterium]|nr:hypothetical protein [Clostridia bacterium]
MGERLEFSHNGICHLILGYAPPALTDGRAQARILRFLDAAYASVKAEAEAALSRLAARYEADPDPKKHLRHRPYLLSLSFSLTKEKNFYRLDECLSLTRSGRSLAEKRRAARFDLQSGRLLGIIKTK